MAGREWGDFPRGSAASNLPYPHRRALDVIANHFGGSLNRALGDAFVASLLPAALRDLAEMGYLRRRWFGYEITLAGRQAMRAPLKRELGG